VLLTILMRIAEMLGLESNVLLVMFPCVLLADNHRKNLFSDGIDGSLKWREMNTSEKLKYLPHLVGLIRCLEYHKRGLENSDISKYFRPTLISGILDDCSDGTFHKINIPCPIRLNCGAIKHLVSSINENILTLKKEYKSVSKTGEKDWFIEKQVEMYLKTHNPDIFEC